MLKKAAENRLAAAKVLLTTSYIFFQINQYSYECLLYFISYQLSRIFVFDYKSFCVLFILHLNIQEYFHIHLSVDDQPAIHLICSNINKALQLQHHGNISVQK